MEIRTHSPEETEAFGVKYAQGLQLGDVVTLDGELGAGKTAFTRGILQGLGYGGRVTSPTFAIANEYDTPRGRVVHFDMYRILNGQSLHELGFEEYLDGEHIVIIEWSGNVLDALPEKFKSVQIIYGEAVNDRVITTTETEASA